IASTIVQNLHQLDMKILPNLPYSPDLSPTNFHFSRSLGNFVTRKRFSKREDIENAFQQFLSLRHSDFELIPSKLFEIKMFRFNRLVFIFKMNG
ncbi:Histone-lysine N-methyltransferase SETMAR, partial [Habropoda laboriosa]